MTNVLAQLERFVWPENRTLTRRIAFSGLALGIMGCLICLVVFLASGTPPTSFRWRTFPGMTGTLLGLADQALFTPLLETVVMIYLVVFLLRVKIPRLVLPVISAAIWASLHFATGPRLYRLWTFAPFFVFTTALLSFTSIRSNRAFLSVSAIHCIMNLMICVFALLLAHAVT
jgi:hypothetical protein